MFTFVNTPNTKFTKSELGTSNNTTIYYTEQAEIKKTKQPYTTQGVMARQVSCNWRQTLFGFRARTGFPVPVNFFTYRKKHTILPKGRY